MPSLRPALAGEMLRQAGAFLVDIPTGPGTAHESKPHWGFDCPACGVAVLFESCTAHHKQKILRQLSEDFCGGRYRTRTCDLLHVKQMLYQLS